MRRQIPFVLLISTVLLAMVSTTAAQIIYVDSDAPGNNNGSSWVDAYNHLQDALADADSSGDVNDIWVAQGIYNPDANSAVPDGTGNREATFQLVNGVALKGGYAGFGEPDPNARDVNIYETILSGDLSGDDSPDFANNGENSHHVVRGSGTNETTVLDGFTISGGNGRRVGGKFNGGGMYNAYGNPTLNNCTFQGNRDCYKGGGMHNYCSNPALINCTFSYNHASGGGGMCNQESSPILTNCIFSENSVTHSGGGTLNELNSSPVLLKCTFSGNSAHWGGGIDNVRGSPKFLSCTFTGNRGGYGGGMRNWYTNPALTNCTFKGNSAAYGGGMLNERKCLLTLTNCIFMGNSARNSGGGIFNDYKNTVMLTNCTFSTNSSPKGNALACDRIRGYIAYWNKLSINNCILWDGQNGIWKDEEALISVMYSNVEGGWSGEGNIDADPCFVDPGFWEGELWTDGDYHLLEVSPCIDSGDNTSVPADTADLDGDGNTTEPIPWDLDGNPRIVDGNSDGNSVVDMGAYEFVPPIEVPMKFTPQALNPGSKGRWVKAHFVLPEEFSVEDVDANTPAVIAPLGIESDYIDVFINEDGFVEVEAAFSRADFCGTLTDNEPVEVTVTGLLTTGQQFYGTDTIRITNKNLEYLAVLSSHWLRTDCGQPDWCDGADLNQDSVVNFVDFALLDGCCIEVINQ